MDCVINNHTRDCFSVVFLFGSVNAVCGRIDREAMDRVLNMEVLEFSIVIRVVLVENGNGSAVAGHVDPG